MNIEFYTNVNIVSEILRLVHEYRLSRAYTHMIKNYAFHSCKRDKRIERRNNNMRFYFITN